MALRRYSRLVVCSNATYTSLFFQRISKLTFGIIHNKAINAMHEITDEQMQLMLTKTKEYSFVTLKITEGVQSENVQSILWEHARRNFSLRADGVLSIVAPVTEERAIAGIYIFNAGKEKVDEILKEDPAVEAGIFTYEIFPIMSFPGDSLPT